MDSEFFSEAYKEYFGTEFTENFEPIRICMDPQRFVDIRNITGGTGPLAMKDLLTKAQEKVYCNNDWYENKRLLLEESNLKLKNEVELISHY